MQKRRRKLNIQKKSLLTREATWVIHTGGILIFAALLRLIFEIQSAAPFPAAIAERFGAMLEYPAAALALLTALAFLVDRVVRVEQETRK